METADGMPDVATRVLEARQAPDIEGLLAKLQRIAEPHARRACRFRAVHAAPLVGCLAQLQVQPHLLVELTLASPAREQEPQSSEHVRPSSTHARWRPPRARTYRP